MATKIEKLQKLGYDVSVAFGDDDPDAATVYYFSGPGVAGYAREDDDDLLDSLLDPDAHRERQRQVDNPPEPEQTLDLAGALERLPADEPITPAALLALLRQGL